jgi:hypothetical protein
MKSNLVRCLRCKTTLIREETETHDCIAPHKGVRRAEVSRWWESKNERGEPLLIALGIDGYIYRLTRVQVRPIFEELQSTETLHPEKRSDSTEDFTEP